MAPTIRVDDEVYGVLQQQAEPFVDTPNTVLRRLLRLPGSGATTANPAAGRTRRESPSKLHKLVEAGCLRSGEKLVWARRNQGERFEAELGERGTLTLEDGSIHQTPSGAARHLTGYEVNGWKVWKRASDGTSLYQLWKDMERA